MARRKPRPKILLVGDSLGVGTLPHLRGVRGDARVGRGSAEAVSVLANRLRPGHEAVIFDVGTNDPDARTLKRSLRQADRLTGDRPLFVATVNGPDAGRKNRALRRYARRHGDVVVVPWAERGSTSDGVHTTPAGYRNRSQLFRTALRGDGSGGGDGPVAHVAGVPDQYTRPIQRAARRYGIRPADLAGLIEVESNFDASAVSPAGARGSTQFMPGTAPSYGVRYGTDQGAINSQIFGAAKYLRDLGYKRGDPEAIRLALASYNAGPGNPGAAGDYPEKVLAAAGRYRGAFSGGGSGGGGAGATTFKIPVPGEMQVDEAAYEEALRHQKIASMLADDSESTFLSDLTLGGAKAPKVDLDLGGGENSILFRSGLLSTDPVNPADFQRPGPDREITVRTGGKGKAGPAGGGGGKSSAPSLAGVKIRKDGNKGAKMLAEWATRGVYGSGERTPAQNAAVGGAEGSDHLTTRRDASAVDAKYGSGAMIAKRLGLGKRWKKGTYDRHIIRVDGRTYSVQILEDVDGHYDHTHLGIERV